MGLFWSMKSHLNSKKLTLQKLIRDIENPLPVSFRLYDSHLKYEDLCNSTREVIAEASVKRWYKSPGVERITVRWKRVRGTLFVPDGIGPFPALIDLFGYIGGLMEHHASLLASRGYLSLALAYCEYDDLPKIGDEIDLEYFEEARKFLESRPETNRDKIGVIGHSFGGMLALACATYLPKFKCAVSINGPVFPFGATLMYKGRRWKAKRPNTNLKYTDNGAVVAKYRCDEHYDVNSLGGSLVEFAGCGTPFLFVFGKDDDALNVPKTVSFINELFQKKEGDYNILTYPGAGHLLEPPYFPLLTKTYIKHASIYQNFGGGAKEHAKAQKYAWRAILEFLNAKLLNKSSKL